MKRLFTYILTLLLLPQIASASVVVGKTEGTFAVSAKGAATYTIPLTIPKGMSDFKPELSLVYDSQDGSGIMGLGWSIKGMHTISTVSKCKYFDGTNQGTAYALDGMRLIETTSPNGQLYYRTEYDRGDSISLIQNGSDIWFQIKSLDGCIYRYGSTTGRYINGNNKKWAIDYAQDALGNYISYTYDQNGGLYPTSITYGRNIHGTAGVTCTISFTYDNSTTKHLTKIECKYNGNIYRSYTFDYENSPSQLTSITEGGRSSTTFTATSFTWDQNRISSITDGLGAEERYVYDNLNNNIYTLYSNYVFPNDSKFRQLQYGERTVIVSRTESTPTDSRTTKYHYECGVYHKNGKGFLGFKEITARLLNPEGEPEVRTETTRTLDKEFCTFLPEDVIQYSHEWGQQLAWDYYDRPTIVGAGGRAYRIPELCHIESTTEGGFEVCHDNIYNVNGLLKKKRYDDGFLEVEDNTTAYWECPIDTIRIKGLPSEVTTRRFSYFSNYADDDEYEIYETTSYERDPNTGLVLKEIKKRSGAHVRTDGYSYNEYGQVTRHWIVAYGSTDTLATRYEYDTYGRLKREYNPLGQSKSYYYNTNTGALSRVYDFNRATTSYTYDGMGRETKCTGPSKIITTSRYTGNYGGSAYRIYVNETGKTPVTTYYDAWERKIAESTPLANGTAMYTDYQYLPNGKVGFVSFPHKVAETTQEGTTYTYDDYSYLLTEARDSNGKINTWSYSGGNVFNTTSCIDGMTTTKCPIFPGVFRKIEENGKSVEYSYNIDGNILKILTGYSSEGELQGTNFKYDIYGRLIRITDANGVTKQYEYDDNGYLRKTTIDGDSVITNYDKYGRLMSKTWTGPDGESHTVTYTYNTVTNKKHLVAKEQGDNYTYNYSYDTYGKLTYKSHYVRSGREGRSVSTNIEYNSDKQISKKTSYFGFCPSSITEQFGYKYGVLVADTLGGFPAYRLTKQDRWGNPTEEKLFYGTTTRLFDDYGHMLSMNHTGYTPQNYAISDSCEYDLQTGNMIAKNAIPLTYNDNNRLTGWGSHTYSYDDKGNITHQPLIGDFTYEGFKLIEAPDADNFNYNYNDSIKYYKALGRPKSIQNSNYKAEFSYDGDGNRILMEVYKKVQGQFRSIFRRYYLGENVEMTVDSLNYIKMFYYAGDDPETAPAIVSFEGSDNTGIFRTDFYQTYRDNVGNVLLYEDRETGHWFFNYSPWGVRAMSSNETNLLMPSQNTTSQVYRTYKGYENLWMFGLLFDKTRLYDPYLGRYLSPDPVYNITGGPLDHNPYVFSKNNPFRVVK